MFIPEEILSLLTLTVKDILNNGLSKEKIEELKKTKYSSKYGLVSLASSTTQVKTAASLVWITGGPNVVQILFKETLPSWLISSIHGSDSSSEKSRGMFAMMVGHALAYFIVYTGIFAWGVDLTSSASKRGPKALEKHLKFLVSVLDGKISLGCNKATYIAYVTGYISLMVSCTPAWMLEVDVEVVKRVCRGLKQWNEEDLALSLLGISGIGAYRCCCEMIIETGF